MASYPDPAKYGGRIIDAPAPAAPTSYPDPAKYGGRIVGSTAPVETAPEPAPVADPNNPWAEPRNIHLLGRDTGVRAPNWLAGAGRGIMTSGQGVKQMGLKLGEQVGLVPEGRSQEYGQQLRGEQAAYERNYGDSLAAGIGNVGGQILATAPVAFVPGGQALLPLRLAALATQGALGASSQPVTGEGNYWQQKAEQAQTGALWGAGTGAALAGVGKTLETVSPQNAVARLLNWRQNKALQTPHGQEGLDIVQQTGIELTPAATSGSSAVNLAENAARQSFFTSDKARQVDQKIAKQSIDYINKVMDNIAPGGKSAETVGDTVRDAIKTGAQRIARARDWVANRDYGVVRRLAGNQPVISFDNAVGELKKIIAENKGVGGADADKIATQAKSLLRKLGRKVKRNTGLVDAQGNPIIQTQEVISKLDINKAMKTRRFYMNAAKGTGNVFSDIDKTLNRKLAGRIARSIEEDFQAAANAGQGPMYAAFKRANANYGKASDSIKFIEKSALGKLLGEELSDAAISGMSANTIPSERIASRLLTLSPSEIKVARKIMEAHAPDALQASKRYVLEQALAKGMDIAPSAGANAPALAGNKFINALLPDDNMRALFAPQELNEINLGVNALKRWGDKTGYNFSGTAPMNEFLGLVNSLVDLSGKTLATTGGKALGLRQVADAMADPVGRGHLLNLARFGPRSRKAANALSYFAAIAGSQNSQAAAEGTEDESARRYD